MNHRAPPRALATVRRALLWIPLLILPGLTPAGTAPLWHVERPAGNRRQQPRGPLPYLPLVGAPPLRFQEPPAALESSAPVSAAASTSVLETDNASADQRPQTVSEMREPTATAATALVAGDPTVTSPPLEKPPVPILHDQLRPEVRPEDFLPYFQFPGTRHRHSGKPSIIVPAPLSPAAPAASLPPSSATYTRTPE